MLKQVLIVGDDGDGCSQLVEALSSAYELRLAKCGDEALSTLSGKNASRISAILLDLSRSSEDGIAFLQTLSGTPGLRDIPVLILSDPADHAEELKRIDYGMFDYVTMPFNPAILVLRLKATIERSEYATFSKYRYLAEYDAISGVYNRAKFYDSTRRILDDGRQPPPTGRQFGGRRTGRATSLSPSAPRCQRHFALRQHSRGPWRHRPGGPFL